MLVHVFVFYFSGNHLKGYAACGPYCVCFDCVDITERSVTRVVLLMCHVRSSGPRGGIRQRRLRKIKADFYSLFFFKYDPYAKARVFHSHIPTPIIQSQF